MINELNNMDDLLDDNIGKSLGELGFIFPSTPEDFRRIEHDLKNNAITLPKRLQDPYSFLGKRAYHPISKNEHGKMGYTQELAQAARDGKPITEDIRRKMVEDKLKSEKTKKE